MKRPQQPSIRLSKQAAEAKVWTPPAPDPRPMRWRVNTSDTHHVEFRETWQAIGFAVGMLLNDMRRVNVTVLDLTRHCDWYVHRVGTDQVEFRVEPKPCSTIAKREMGPRRYASRRETNDGEE